MTLNDPAFDHKPGAKMPPQPEPKTAHDYFPRTRWDKPPQTRKEAAQATATDRIRYAVRLASAQWTTMVKNQEEECIHVDHCQLAVLDKVFEMCVLVLVGTDSRCEEYRLSDEMVPRDFEAWRDICASFVGEAIQLARRAIPWPDHFEQSEWEDIRRFVLMVKDYGFRPWADAWGEAPPLPKFDCALLKKWDPASRAVPLCVKTFASHVHWVEYGELEEPLWEEDWREPEKDWKAGREHAVAERKEAAKAWREDVAHRAEKRRKETRTALVWCSVLAVPLLYHLCCEMFGVTGTSAETVMTTTVPVVSCVDICVARCNALG